MAKVKVSEGLWDAAMLPEGFVERWLVADGEMVTPGEAVVEVRVENALHKIPAPAAGRLHIWTPKNAIIEPGSSLGEIKA
jgi:pyruvate/2-oxoglutarate dehydrogenase complex dihydrolipoamide acyltransferase (E2) component